MELKNRFSRPSLADDNQGNRYEDEGEVVHDNEVEEQRQRSDKPIVTLLEIC